MMMNFTLSFISLTIHLASIGHAKMPQQREKVPLTGVKI